MAGDLQQQLSFLRQKIARIDRKFTGARKPAPPSAVTEAKPERYEVDEYLPGSAVETEFGRHWELEKLYERRRRHGSMGIADLEQLPADLLGPISGGEITDAPAERWAFLDTETTGLAGGSGTYAFLIGVGRIAPDGFRVRQFFMREYSEERSLLNALSDHLRLFKVLITYNGRTYDQPLLETRYRMSRARPPFAHLQHLDLLFGSRRLWKLRFESCRLVQLENSILGVERQGDLPGELIPYVYFEYLRTREMARLLPLFHHNATDILSLACLTGIVPWAFHDPEQAQFAHGAEMVGLARWWRQAGHHDNAAALFRRAIDRGLPDALLFRTMWDAACLEKKRGDGRAALPLLTDLASCRNPYRAEALQELARYYERREGNHALALEMTVAALEHAPTEALQRRRTRLEKRLAGGRSRRLL
ncbi:MAG TPA: ribonuclease H-like domain-containing protein [Bryobacteraceae bacterium]|nr:ribonuclease H-like domain-containing protein [Bryobacteraceae bacterium]